MAFEDRYSVGVTQDQAYSLDPKTSILAFFGYKLKKDSDSTLSTYGGNTIVTQVSSDTYKVDKTPSGIYYKTSYKKVWERTQGAYVDYALEAKMQKWLKDNGFDDIFVTPYVAPSVEEYHQCNGHGPKSKFFGTLALIIVLICAVATTLLAINIDQIVSALPEFFADLKVQIAMAPMVVGVPTAIVFLVIRAIHNKIARNNPLSERSKNYQEKMQKAYFESMVNLFGKELGEEMQAFVLAKETEKANVSSKARNKKK